MPRSLPWLNDSAKAKAQSRTIAQPNQQKQRDPTPDLDDDSFIGIRASRKKRRGSRTPSTSPPPSPPRQEYMIEGLEADDAWVMVEDEFLETAKLFTRHLHHAEYQRMKRNARKQTESAVRNILRPVDPRAHMSAATARRLKSEKLAAAQEEALQELADSESNDELEVEQWIDDPCLAGLMKMPSTLSRKLPAGVYTKSNTRAAAGYDKAAEHSPKSKVIGAISGSYPTHAGDSRKRDTPKDSAIELDMDDLDEPAFGTIQQPFLQGRESVRQDLHQVMPSKPHSSRQWMGEERAPHSMTNPSYDSSKIKPNTLTSASVKPTKDAFSETTGDLPTRTPLHNLSHRLAKRRMEKSKKENDGKRKDTSITEIPTFLV